MNRSVSSFFVIVLLLLCVANKSMGSERILTMSTTTSTESSGLLDVLLPAFKAKSGITVKVIAKGTGAAIRDGMEGNVDVIFVHARAREDKFVADGYGTQRFPVMHNDFIVLGGPSDPAAIKGMGNCRKALAKIAAAGSLFISRGDDSGTHTKEQYLWKQSGVKLAVQEQVIVKKGKEKTIRFNRPEGSASWYRSIGQGMGKTITFADEKQAYTLSDRGTYIKYKYGKKPAVDLTVLCEGDAELANPYGIIPVNPKKHPHVKHDLAQQFVNWLISEKGQGLIKEYRLVGKQLFYPDAM